jgi:hypothetical protein
LRAALLLCDHCLSCVHVASSACWGQLLLLVPLLPLLLLWS